MKKRITGALTAAAMLLTGAGLLPGTPVAAEAEFDYAKALQMSLYFYECQQAGHLPEWNRVEWRADSTTIDEIDGGWYDAGDHVKFNHPMAYSAAMLAWGLYQYPEGIESCGEMTSYVNNLEFVMDYFVRCDKGDTVVFQVGNGTDDHTWWGPVELYQYGMEDAGGDYAAIRETLEASEGCSCVFGNMAAALAAGYCALDGRIDETKREGYLTHAEHIFELADASRSDDVYQNSNASQFYRSSHFYDELFYAANWLYIASGDQVYLEKASSYIPLLDTELGSDELKFSWEHCWDDAMQGGMLLYAQNTMDPFYIGRVERHLQYIENEAKKVDGTLTYIQNWGCCRYAATGAFLTAVACDTVLKGKDTSAHEAYYESQINYILGDNPNGHSYVVGFGENSPRNAHHRTSHGSWKNDVFMPDTNRHILYGALVGGPTEDGQYEDDRNNYINNEVTTDYNAGYTALLCKMIDKYGGQNDPAFPPKEAHDGPEFYVETLSKGMDAQGATLSFKITNHSAWPARVQDNISFRYYMDLSEAVDKGLDPTKVVVRCDRDQAAMYAGKGIAPAEISDIQHYDGDIYYVEVNLPDGRAVLPVSEGMQQCEILLAFVLPDYQSGWDPSNDFSNTELLTASGEADEDGTLHGIVTKYVPVYVNGTLYYGIEPDGTEADGDTAPVETPTQAPTAVPTQAATQTPTGGGLTVTVWGDADDDGDCDIMDVITVNKEQLGSEVLSEQGALNADVDRSGALSFTDAVNIMRSLVDLVTLPV
ncbi:MAG: glycoside hydrolase family 9 protein [Oscillospiraceae bacterium]|nr:glycoside hydrolase family 9 protein [Oscillospiraceae bacterium]